MKLDALNDNDTDVLIQKVDQRVKPIFTINDYAQSQKRAIYRYLFSRRPNKFPPSLKNRIVGLYDPQADRANRFRDKLRFCINVYVGCEHNCGYCYVNGYSQEAVGISPHPKKDFEKKLINDFNDLTSLGVPSTPLHISNSTDPLQEKLERTYHHTLFILENILKYRNQFSSVVILTKNPSILCEDPYLSVLKNKGMRPVTVQVSCAFWKDDIRSFFEVNAPSIEDRLKAIQLLIASGVNIELRIDPLFPSSRISAELRLHKPLSFYSIPEPQTQEDLTNLIHFAKKSNVSAVIAKPLKVPMSKKSQLCKLWFKDIYRDLSPKGKIMSSGGSWRLPSSYQIALINSVSSSCSEEGIPFRHCMHDVLMRD